MTFKFCPLCGKQLSQQRIDGSYRLACASSSCRFIHWNNPIPVVSALVRVGHEYVLGRSANWPDGLFSVFTGFLEEGESPEIAVAREVGEELGLEVNDVQFIGHFSLQEFNQLIIAFACVGSGSIALGDEISEIRCLSERELATYDFGPLRLTQEIVARWVGMRR